MRTALKSHKFWPDHLVQELAGRRGIIFLGAGASMSCATSFGPRPPSWNGLLTGLGAKLKSDPSRAEFNKMMAAHRLLDAAQIVTDGLEYQVLQSELHRCFNNRGILPSSLYESVNLIDQPVVMTTNYDRIYEKFFESLTPPPSLVDPDHTLEPPLVALTFSQPGIVDNLRSDRRVLLKLHGDVNDANSIVLSRSQYSRARYDYPEFFRVVSALMLTRTLFFIGSGFNGDPDIDLLLEDASFNARAQSTHYAIVPEGKGPSERKAIKSSFNIEILEYPLEADGGHGHLLENLGELAALVNDLRG